MLAKLKRRESELAIKEVYSRIASVLFDPNLMDCPVCQRPLSQDERLKAVHVIENHRASLDDDRELAEVRRQMEVLQSTLSGLDHKALRLLWASLDQNARDIHRRETEIEEIEKQLTGGRDEDVRNLRAELNGLIGQIKEIEIGIDNARKKLDENANNRERVQKQIDRKRGGQLQGASAKAAVAEKLRALFDEAVAEYREQLRHRIEADATRHFRSLTTEPEYERLRINDNYGLTIVHKNGQNIPVRSAGAEHVVALSLVGVAVALRASGRPRTAADVLCSGSGKRAVH